MEQERQGASLSYAVSFGKQTEADGLGGVMINIYGLRGAGEIQIGAAVRLRGKKPRPFWTSKDVEAELDPSRIQNVLLHGTTVRFEVEGGNPWRKSQPGFVALKAKTPEEAAAIAAALPRTVTEAFKQRLIEQAEFEAQIARVAPRSIVTPALVAINVLVFIAMAVATGGDSIFKPDGRVHVEWGSNFGPLTTDGQWWRMFTCMFLHFGLIHIAFNMAGLWDGGRLTERLYGSVEFFLLYVISGLAGSTASLLWHPVVNSAGASGAIFGVYGGLLAFMLRPGHRVPAATTQTLWIGTGAFLVYSLVNGMAREGIDNAAHVGGLVGGVLSGLILARPMDATRQPGTDWRRVGIAALAALVILPLLATQIRNVGVGYKKEQQYQADLKWFGAEEERLNKLFGDWRALAKAGGQPDAALAERLEREVAKPWQAVYDRVAANPLEEDSKLKAHQGLVLEFLKSRADAYALLVDAVRTEDRGKMAAATDKFAAGAKTIEKLKQFNSAK